MLRVKVFDEGHEKDLENSINSFLSSIDYEITDIKFNVSCSMFAQEQLFCFSAMVIYEIK